MARKEAIVTLMDDGQEYTFSIRQMAVSGAIDWGTRAIVALAKGGAEFPDGLGFDEAIQHIASSGPSAVVKTLGGLDPDDVRPLLDVLLGCCSRVVGNHKEKCTHDLVDNYLVEPKTLISLYAEAFKINFMTPVLPAENP